MREQKVRKKKTCFNAHFHYSQSEITGLSIGAVAQRGSVKKLLLEIS